MFFHTPAQVVWNISMFGIFALALWRGGAPERLASIGMVADAFASALVQNTHDWNQTQWGDLAVDLAYLALLLWLALRTSRLWPLWAAAFQLLSVIIYVARIVDPRIGALAPYQAVVIWSYLVLIAILVGVWGEIRRRDRKLAAGDAQA
jgi:hypothetical protein